MMGQIKAIICDMDGTALSYNNTTGCSWDQLIYILDKEKKERWCKDRDLYLSQDLSNPEIYNKWFISNLSLLKGKKLSDAECVLFPLPYCNGFCDFFGNLNKGIKKGILSNGLGLAAEEIKQEFNFDEYIAHYLEIKNGIFTGFGERGMISLCKVDGLKKMSERFGVDLENVCYIGDSRFDISCLDRVGLPVAFNPKPGLKKYAERKSIPFIYNFRELNNILEL